MNDEEVSSCLHIKVKCCVLNELEMRMEDEFVV